MKKVVSFIAFAALFAAIGMFAFMSAPIGSDFAPGDAPAESVAAPVESVANAPSAPVYNSIAMPLDASASLASWDAAGLAAYLGSSVTQLLYWDSTLTPPAFRPYIPAINGPDNFPLEVGGAYMILVDSTGPAVATFVGDVPAQGSIDFNLVGTSPACTYNTLSVPLDQSIADAAGLATALGGAANVSQLLYWDASLTPPQFRPYVVAINGPDNFAVQSGYPYFVCALTSQTWP